MEIFDPIHGSIEVCEDAKNIIDTVEFQRLRNIKQLGYCYYVFPGASHNRFEHSVGVYHLSKKYMSILNKDHIWFNKNDIKLISIAALIHDMGHGPFSHLFDDLTNSQHELRSIEIFKYINVKYTLNYSEDDIKFITDVLIPIDDLIENRHKYLYQIVSNKNGMDVDRMDYIMRDIYMIGLNYGIEYERIMKGSVIRDNNIVFYEKVRTPVEDFYRVRYNLYKDVYNHSAVRAIEYMIKEILSLCDTEFKLKEIINNKDWNEFMKINDSIINYISFINSNNDNIIKAKQIINNIHSRKLYKLLGEIQTHIKIKIDPIYESNYIIDYCNISYYNSNKPYFINSNVKQIIPSTQHKLTTNNLHLIKIYYKWRGAGEDVNNIDQPGPHSWPPIEIHKIYKDSIINIWIEENLTPSDITVSSVELYGYFKDWLFDYDYNGELMYINIQKKEVILKLLSWQKLSNYGYNEAMNGSVDRQNKMVFNLLTN